MLANSQGRCGYDPHSHVVWVLADEIDDVAVLDFVRSEVGGAKVTGNKFGYSRASAVLACPVCPVKA